MNKKALVVGLGNQGQQYVDYFLKHDYIVEGSCLSEKTKKEIEAKKNIQVYQDLDQINFSDYSIISLALPSDVQGEIAVNILQSGFHGKLVIETPISWDNDIIGKLQKYENVIFFLEEYYTLLAQTLRKIDIEKIQEIQINIYASKEDYHDPHAREVSYMHVRHNFLGIPNIQKVYNIFHHESEKIFYEVSFIYLGKKFLYNFTDEKYLLIGEKKYDDPFCFDIALSKLLSQKEKINQYYTLEI